MLIFIVALLSVILPIVGIITGLRILRDYSYMWNFKRREFLKLSLQARVYLAVICSTFASCLFLLLVIDYIGNNELKLFITQSVSIYWGVYHILTLLAVIVFHRHVHQSLSYDVVKRRRNGNNSIHSVADNKTT